MNYEQIKNEFDWGPTNDEMKRLLEREFFNGGDCVYEKFNKVKEGDVVVDLGSSVGLFGYQLKDRNAKNLYCVEPSIYEVDALENNLKGMNYSLHNYAIGDNNDEVDAIIFNTQNKVETVKSKRFNTFIKENNINQIDFLKTDCEGGEYEVFNIDNICWLKENMKYCAGEWHLETKENKKKFREFRDVFLRVFPNHEVYSVNEVNIKWDLWNEHFIDYYKQVLIYIDNRK